MSAPCTSSTNQEAAQLNPARQKIPPAIGRGDFSGFRGRIGEVLPVQVPQQSDITVAAGLVAVHAVVDEKTVVRQPHGFRCLIRADAITATLSSE